MHTSSLYQIVVHTDGIHAIHTTHHDTCISHLAFFKFWDTLDADRQTATSFIDYSIEAGILLGGNDP
jgi:hypothetical protein